MSPREQNQLQDLYFLGPKGEQRKLFQEMIELINNDMIFWRRNFHPKDPPSIPYRNFSTPLGQEYQEHLIQSLVQLLADLKMDLPFFSPRYLAHMTADVTLPALLGYYAGLLYNANNVSGEASPVTLKYELEVGRQFAKLFDYHEKTSFGHITSGGTVANFESVFYHRAIRFVPVTMGLVIKKNNLAWPSFLDTDLWGLLNVSLSEIPALLKSFLQTGSSHGLDLESELKKYSPASLGDRAYWREVFTAYGSEVKDPVIVVPSTAHYSWSKAAHLFGIGRQNCLQVRLDRNLSMSLKDLNQVLERCQTERIPIIQTVCVLGSTEFGSFDPLDEILETLGQWKERGLYTPVHIDGAYGGYFKTMFKAGQRFHESSAEAQSLLPRLYEIFSKVGETDSMTVDPHKLGHTPYGAGVFLTRHGFIKEFVAETADYCLTDKGLGEDEDFPLGKFILEGSKPGASATSVYFANKIIPLDSDGYGGLLLELIKQTRIFHQELLNLNHAGDEFSRRFEVRTVCEPGSNLECFYIKPRVMKSLLEVNRFNEKLIQHYFPKRTNHIQEFNYFVSKTRLKKTKLMPEVGTEVFSDLSEDTDSVQLIRLVFLNRWSHQTNSEGVSYVSDFLAQLKNNCQEALDEN